MCQDSADSTLKNGLSTKTPSWTVAKDRKGRDTRDNKESFAQKQARKAANKAKTPDAGEHESWEYYDACFIRERNNGIFVADRSRAHNRGATRTRQNPAGTRRGYECPEGYGFLENSFKFYFHAGGRSL